MGGASRRSAAEARLLWEQEVASSILAASTRGFAAPPLAAVPFLFPHASCSGSIGSSRAISAGRSSWMVRQTTSQSMLRYP